MQRMNELLITVCVYMDTISNLMILPCKSIIFTALLKQNEYQKEEYRTKLRNGESK